MEKKKKERKKKKEKKNSGFFWCKKPQSREWLNEPEQPTGPGGCKAQKSSLVGVEKASELLLFSEQELFVNGRQ